MTYKAATDLLELINIHMPDKTLFLSNINEKSFKVIKALNTQIIPITDGLTIPNEKSL